MAVKISGGDDVTMVTVFSHLFSASRGDVFMFPMYCIALTLTLFDCVCLYWRS
jgi:hypothetical protein